MATTSFAWNDPAVLLVGTTQDWNDTGIADERGFARCLVSFVATGTACSLGIVHATAAVQTYTVYVDGAAATLTVPAGPGTSYTTDFCSLFTGLADAPHTVDIYGQGIEITRAVGGIQVTGAAPALSRSHSPRITAPTGANIASNYTNGDLAGVFCGPASPITAQDNGYARPLSPPSSIVRWRGKGGKMWLMSSNGGAGAVYSWSVDGVESAVTNMVTIGNDGGGHYWHEFDFGAPSAAFHDYELHLTYGVSSAGGNGIGTCYGMTFEQGMVDQTYTYPTRPIICILGDSIRQGNSAALPSGDAKLYFPWIASRFLGADPVIRAAGGTTITDTGVTYVNQIISDLQGAAQTPAMFEIAWGINDTHYPAIDATGHYTAGGAAYPNATDQGYIDTYKTNLTTCLNNLFAAFPAVPVLVAKLFKGGANDWLRDYWATNAQQAVISSVLTAHPTAKISLENTDTWYDGVDGLHPQYNLGASQIPVPAEKAWGAATGLTPTCATPTITPNGGNIAPTQTVTLTCTTPGSVIHYSLDGSTPNASSPVYSAPLAFTSGSVTVKWYATAPGYADSAVASATFTVVLTAGTLSAPIGATSSSLNGIAWTAAAGGVGAITAQFQISPHAANSWSYVPGAATTNAATGQSAPGLATTTQYDLRVAYTDSATPTPNTVYSNTVTATTTGGNIVAWVPGEVEFAITALSGFQLEADGDQPFRLGVIARRGAYQYLGNGDFTPQVAFSATFGGARTFLTMAWNDQGEASLPVTGTAPNALPAGTYYCFARFLNTMGTVMDTQQLGTVTIR